MGKRTHQVTLIPGDWIGPETCEVVKAVIAGSGVDIVWHEQICKNGQIDDAIIDSCRQTGVVLKAKLGGHQNPGELPPTVQLRKALKCRRLLQRASLQAALGELELAGSFGAPCAESWPLYGLWI